MHMMSPLKNLTLMNFYLDFVCHIHVANFSLFLVPFLDCEILPCDLLDYSCSPVLGLHAYHLYVRLPLSP